MDFAISVQNIFRNAINLKSRISQLQIVGCFRDHYSHLSAEFTVLFHFSPNEASISKIYIYTFVIAGFYLQSSWFLRDL